MVHSKQVEDLLKKGPGMKKNYSLKFVDVRSPVVFDQGVHLSAAGLF